MGMFVAVETPLMVSTSAFCAVSHRSSMPLVKLAPPEATVIAVPPAFRTAVPVPVGAWVLKPNVHSQPEQRPVTLSSIMNRRVK